MEALGIATDPSKLSKVCGLEILSSSLCITFATFSYFGLKDIFRSLQTATVNGLKAYYFEAL